MPDFLSVSVSEFLVQTAAKQPTPGGGSVAALAGALAASLAAMAVEYTIGKKAFAGQEPELRAALRQFQRASALLQELIAEDIAAFAALSSLLKLPAGERAIHPDYAAAVVAAIRAPQTAAALALAVLERCAALKDKTNPQLVSDLAIAAVYAHATVQACEFNVRVNLSLLPNPAEAETIKREVSTLAARAGGIFGPLHAELLARF